MRHLKSIGQDSVALTDHGNMFALSEFSKAAKDEKIKLIAGCEFYVAAKGADNTDDRDTYHLTVIALDQEGYYNLCRLHAHAWEHFYYDPRTDLDTLEKYSKGLVALSGCLGGALPKALLRDGVKAAETRLRDLHDIFGKRFYIELQNHGIPEQIEIEPQLRKWSKQYGIPLCATNDSHYIELKDWVPHDVAICMGTGMQIGRTDRKKEYVPKEFRLKTADDMLKRFEPAVVQQSYKIAEMADGLELDKKTFAIPEFTKGSRTLLKRKVYDGLKERYDKHWSDKHIVDRAEYEIAAIEKGGFADYMLIVADVYDFMRKEDIPYGAGRGSAAGSIVSYALGITDVDPLRFKLLFERFINPDRISMPDIDIDISQERRDEVIDYVKQRWGHEYTAQIITYQTLGAKSSVRRLANVMGKSPDLCDKIARLIPKEGSLTVDRESRHYLQDALRDVKELKKLYDSDENAKQIIDTAMTIEGLPWTASVHAAGVVIADKPLRDGVPMAMLLPSDKEKAKKGRIYTVGWDMRQIEDIGLIKFDFLGLRTEDVVKACLDAMKRAGIIPKDFKKTDIPFDDPKTFDLLSRGQTAGIFQLESNGMRRYIRELRPERVEDVMAMVALYRPGPMEFIPSFIKRRHGQEKITYPHYSLKPILEDTYGIAVYQEQLMQIAEVIAGWTKGRADQLRKVIGKKIIDKMAAEKDEFVQGAVKQGHKRAWAENLFTDFIEPAARYSFNRSHSCAYGALSYWTAYLKANYPTYYFGALLASVQDKQEKVTEYINDARSLGIAILPPDIHESGTEFTALPKKKAVRYGLSAIKNVGEQAVEIILRERKKQPFTDLFDFVARTRNRLITTRTIESLIWAGALDGLPGTRAEKAASVEVACKRSDELEEDAKRSAAGTKAKNRRIPIPDAVLVSDPEGIDTDNPDHWLLSKERELVGTYISGHPFHWYANDAREVASTDLQGVRELDNEQSAVICGIITAVKEHQTKKGKKSMCFLTLEDDKCALEVTVFPRQYEKYKDLFVLDAPIVIQGNADIPEVEASDVDDENAEQHIPEAKFLLANARLLDEAPHRTKYVDRPSPKSVSKATEDGKDSDLKPAGKGSYQVIRLDGEDYRFAIDRAAAQFEDGSVKRITFLLPNDEEIQVA